MSASISSYLCKEMPSFYRGETDMEQLTVHSSNNEEEIEWNEQMEMIVSSDSFSTGNISTPLIFVFLAPRFEEHVCAYSCVENVNLLLHMTDGTRLYKEKWRFITKPNKMQLELYWLNH